MTENWDDVSVEVTEMVARSVEPVARKAADDIYERLMEAAQSYLADNLRFNLSSRLQSAEGEADALRLRVWKLDNTVVPALLEALIAMEAEKADYMRLNNLGDPAKEHTNKLARKAISLATGASNAG